MDMQQLFFQIMRQKRGPQKMSGLEQLHKIVSEKAIGISERAVMFVRAIFESQNIRTTVFLNWNYHIPNPTRSSVCSKIMNGQGTSTSFRCFDCMQSSSSCICAECFADGDHTNHNYVQYNSTNGCCDCGNAEAWNQKGFCKTHSSIMDVECEIQQSIRSQFLEEGHLILYIYFYLITKAENRKSLADQYGNQVFKFLAQVAHNHLEMKILACELMNSKFSEDYPYIPMREHSIIEILFRLPNQKVRAHTEVINWIFQTFPVESMCKKVVQEYFGKMRRISDMMTGQTHLGGLNFQYMSSVKMIIKMIKAKQLQIFQTPIMKLGHLNEQDLLQIPLVFKKYYEDLDYINNMKSGKDYQELHLQLCNVADMAGYREVTKVGSKISILPQQYILFNVDEMFLKTFNKFVTNVKENKKLLEKCMMGLFHYIFNAGQNWASMAQERAFAMMTMAYFDGDLNQLFNQSTCASFIAMLGVQKSQVKYMLTIIAEATLQSTVNWLHQVDHPKTSYEQYFMRMNLEKLVPQYLDKIFWKILILMSQGYCSFDEIILQFFKKKQDIMEIQDLQMEAPERTNKMLQFGSTIMVAMSLIGTVIRVDMDETVVNGIIGNINKKQLFEVYSRIVATFKQLNPKELKQICLEICNNEEIFEEFVMNNVIMEKGKFRPKEEVRPFQFLIYNGIFKNYSTHLPENDVTYLTGNQTFPRFKSFKLFHPELLNLAIEKCMELISLLADQRNPSIQNLLNVLVRQIFSLYVLDQHQEHRYFFRTLLNPSLRCFFSKTLIEQITMIQKEEQDLKQNLDKIKEEQAEVFRAKRQKITQKKKMKEQKMKKNRDQMLSKFNKQIEEIQNQQDNRQCCIYCKQIKDEPLSFISYIGLTNIIQKNILKNNQFHYFLSSCGHKIHPSCFMQVNQKQVKNFCFLCKHHANILMPQLETAVKMENMAQKAEEFFSNIITGLVSEHQFENGQIGSFSTRIFDNNMEIVLSSLAKEFVYNGLHDYEHFKKNLYPLYKQIFKMLQELDKIKLKQYFENIQHKREDQNQHEKHHLESLRIYFELKIEEFLLDSNQQQKIMALGLTESILVQAERLFGVIRNNQPQIQIQAFHIINPDTILAKLPSNLTELHQYMGRCKQCPNITNNIFLCLVCGWSACIKCVKAIFQHVSSQHIDGAVVIGCSTGTVKFFMGKGIYQDNSIYQNYMGLNFSQVDTYSQFGKSDKYNINRQKQIQLHRLLMHYGVHQKVFMEIDRS